MIHKKGFFVGIIVFFALTGLGRAQLVLGQYEDEAPVRTWNVFGPTSAASAGIGLAGFARALDATSVFTNPALSARLPSLSLAVTGSYTSTEFFRYATVNTGPVSTAGNLTLGLWTADSAAVTLRWRGWGLGLGYGLLETYGRPTIDASAGPFYSYHFDQNGELKVIHFSLARALGSRLALGVGINAVTGRLDHLSQDTFDGGLDTILQSIGQKYSGFYVTGGLVFDITSSIHLAASVRTPYVKKADSQSIIRWTLVSGPNIEIIAASEDEYHQPLIAGAGVSFDISPEWWAALDATYFGWSSYKVTSFGEELKRDFRDVVRIGFGTEYSIFATLFGWRLRLPIRAGLHFDPQPMKSPESSYFIYSFGTGIHGRRFFLDVSTTSGKEAGSGHSLASQRTVLTLGINLQP